MPNPTGKCRSASSCTIRLSIVAVLGATVDLGLLWGIADTFNGLMAIPNLIALFLLSPVVVELTKDFFANEA